VFTVDAAGLDAEQLFELLTAESARELRHKVGVAGRADGSGKSSTRLLAVRGWILKTNLARASPLRQEVRARVLIDRALGLRAGAWHPNKHWAIVHTDAGWIPLSATPELRTLRSIEDRAARFAAWTRMLARGVEVHRDSGLGLDLNPANFGEEPGGAGLFYIDDELYPSLDLHQIASAIAARIPEEPGAACEEWRSWGLALQCALGIPREERAALAEEIVSYPLPERFWPQRDALVGGLDEEHTTWRPSAVHRRPDLVCVMADVHANLPALEAVIAAARQRGARRFLFLGDAVGYGPHPRECVRVLAELDAICVRGNHDQAIASGIFDLGMNRLARACAAWTRDRLQAAELDWLVQLPLEHVESGWMAVHGAPRDPYRFLAYVYELTYEDNLDHMEKQGLSLCFYGHTHLPLAHAKLPGGSRKIRSREVIVSEPYPFLVNPGSVGQPRDGDPRASYALWEPGSGRVLIERVFYRMDLTLRDLGRHDLPAELAMRLREAR
jgi:predicted phosphodiesterase